MVPKIKGLDTPLQNAFGRITLWNPTNATAGVWFGTVGATTGTYARITYYYYSFILVRSDLALMPINIRRNTELCTTRGSNNFFFMPGQEWMFDQRRAPLLECTQQLQ
jgi:hypothetical protein